MVSDHEQRLSDLEEWQDQVNRNIASLQRLLNTTDYITAVTPLMEGGEEVGYTITFLNSDPINIYHGKKGDEGEEGDKGEQGDDGHTPQIGLTQGTDGNWYWTLDGELMLDKDNNPIRANGEDGQQGQPGQTGASAPTPQIKLGSTLDTNAAVITDNGVVQPAAWYLSVDGGQTWYRITGDKGEQGDEGDKGDKGDSMFADDPKLSDDGTHYIFTLSDDDNTDLSDNPTIEIPVYRSLQIGNGSGMFTLTATTQEITLTYPTGTEATDYRILVAQITPEGTDGTYTDIATRADDADGWSVEAKFNSDNTATLAITAGTSSNALLRVTLVKNDGSEVAASCIMSWQGYTIDAETSTYTVYTPQGLRAWAAIYWDYNCTLAADIDMSGQTWPRIGGYSRTFDGAGHIIRNLNATTGFIDMLSSGGIVKNLLLVDADISSNAHAGGIVGWMMGGTVIACAVSGCKVSGTNYAGGIAGAVDAEPNSVIACYATSCDIKGPENTSGHIAGRGESVFFSACYYDGIGNGLGGRQDQPRLVEQVRQNSWLEAMDSMNQQLSAHDYLWTVNTDPATQDDFPLVLERRQ